ncbi:hypothetical protein DESACE_01155 [Desulfurella acetivorans A63]|nr:hypothetical protein DESACE_01155 [Desulfurella acetivorans A63]
MQNSPFSIGIGVFIFFVLSGGLILLFLKKK